MRNTISIFVLSFATLILNINVYRINTDINTLKWRVMNLESALRN